MVGERKKRKREDGSKKAVKVEEKKQKRQANSSQHQLTFRFLLFSLVAFFPAPHPLISLSLSKPSFQRLFFFPSGQR
jgi:hypothetical protein